MSWRGLLIAAMAACTGGEDPKDTDDTDASACAVTPGAWSAPDWATTTTDALAARASIDAFVGILRQTEQGARTLTLDEAEAAYLAGTPAVAVIATGAMDPTLRVATEAFVDLAATGPLDLVDDMGMFTPGDHGGIYGTSQRGIDEGGVEQRQTIDKALLGGALYAWALERTDAPTPAEIDAIAAAWGADANLTAGEAETTDSARYSWNMGFHADISASWAAAKAYAADPACAAERDAALVDGFRQWELALYARTVYYVHEARELMASATSDDGPAEALHVISEGIGLVGGFRGLPAPASGPLADAPRVADDAAIDAILAALGVDWDAVDAAATASVVLDSGALEDAQIDVDAAVQAAFGVDPATTLSYRTPTAR